ncbi:MAG: hypothetical protein QOI43_1431, partial [Gaiellales bacterium]|nr:hypothetical protein [Gaiellales bacterium]
MAPFGVSREPGERPGLTRSGMGDERALVHWIPGSGKEPARTIPSPKTC